jgi:hypothetical protein
LPSLLEIGQTKMKTYRVFVTRTYIAVRYYDIEAGSGRDAEKVAVAAANKLVPDARAEATDNGWMLENSAGCACEIPYLGSSSAPFEVEEVFRNKKGIAYSEVGC